MQPILAAVIAILALGLIGLTVIRLAESSASQTDKVLFFCSILLVLGIAIVLVWVFDGELILEWVRSKTVG